MGFPLKTSRLPGALSPSWQDRGCTLPQFGAGDNRPIRSNRTHRGAQPSRTASTSLTEPDGIEERNFLESGPHDREPPVSSRTRRGTIAHKPRRGPSILTVESHRPAQGTTRAPASTVRRSHLPHPPRATRHRSPTSPHGPSPRGPQSPHLQPAVPDVLRRNWRTVHHPQRRTYSPAHHPPRVLTPAIPFLDEARRSCRQSAPITSRDSCPLMPHRPARRAPIHQ